MRLLALPFEFALLSTFVACELQCVFFSEVPYTLPFALIHALLSSCVVLALLLSCLARRDFLFPFRVMFCFCLVAVYSSLCRLVDKPGEKVVGGMHHPDVAVEKL